MNQSEVLNMSESARSLLNRALRFCAASEQCEGDVRRKLADWGASNDEAEAILTLLRDEGYVDDHRYARAYCESKLLRAGWGRQKVAYHLRMKGLASEAVNEGLDAVDDEACRDILTSLAERKAAELRTSRTPPEPPILRRKLTAFLLQRGYPLSLINPIITNILKK